MSAGTVNGLVIPDYFTLSNSSSTPALSSYRSDKEIRSLYARGSFGYKDIIFLEGSVRNDRSSALPKDANSYTYPSVGTSFVFGELIRNTVPALSFGKVRASWAQVGSDLNPYSLALNYTLASTKFGSSSYMGTPNTLVDANIKPALSSAYEFGLDLKFLKDKLGLSVTYYNEDKINEIITVPISGTSGFTSKLINAGKINRHGLEVSLNATPVKTKDVTWTTTVNWAKNTSKVLALAEGVDAITVTSDAFGVGTVVHQVGEAWGQIRGGAYTYKDGKKVLTADGMYVVTPNSYLGSVLPDFTGGWFNQIQYKDFVLSANIEFSKGGKYFSLSDYWGGFSGLFERTAGVNDKGNPIRDPIADGGGVHVQGVTADRC
jgi:outer membrane receptor protein involved in Fe transport